MFTNVTFALLSCGNSLRTDLLSVLPISWVDPEVLGLALTELVQGPASAKPPSTRKAFLGNQQCCSAWQAQGPAEFCELSCFPLDVTFFVHPDHHPPGILGNTLSNKTESINKRKESLLSGFCFIIGFPMTTLE